ncbi:MAG: cation transporter [Lachnospiraceae bacterium]|nr:cation transporter [Lachnospiraceae bacterium]
MKLLYKIMRQSSDSREGVITVTSALGIIINIVISIIKIIIGAGVSSIAIISEGIHSATDAVTSVLAIVGVKLAGKKPTKKHPFGYGRVEYLTSLVIALLIMYMGIEILMTSVNLIFNPTELSISYLTLIIVAVTAVIKLFLGLYTIKKGKSVDSDSLTGIGIECRNDSYAAGVTIFSVVVFLVFNVSIDAYAGIVTALFIMKSGFEILRSSLADLLGKSGNRELANQLYKEIRATEGIINAADMMLHNYGPDAYSASVNVEVSHEKTVGEVYQYLHELQLRILHEYNVTIVFGIYAVDNKTEASKKMREEIAEFVRERSYITGYHALYHDKKANVIYCDLLVDYSDFDWDGLRNEFEEYMRALYPEAKLELVIETEFV